MSFPTFRATTGAHLALLLAVGASGAAAQDDVELLGRVYGARPPAAYYDLRARTPGAFEFGRAWKARNPRLEVSGVTPDGAPRFEIRGGVLDADGRTPRRFDAPAATLGRREDGVEGTFRFPVVLGYFADDLAPPAFDAADVQNEFFDGPNSRGQTIPEFYDAISGGKVELEGRTYGWVRSELTGALTTGGISGLGGRIGLFIHQILEEADDGSVDWGQFDNDGPDGVPDSGDDDGFVDVLVVIHPTWGAECGGEGQNERIWSHKWTLSAAYGLIPTPERPPEPTFATSTTGASGQPIRIDDYTIQPAYSCDESSINEIGVLAHELGHGFGLPDLYCTSSQCPSNGIGRWGLMGQGSWGCGSFDPSRPCAMGAWSKSVLGWVDVQTLAPDTDHGTVTLPPVATARTVLRIDAEDGSDEYYLLENRQRLGVDADLPGSGMVVWHVDPDYVAQRWPVNAVNPNPASGLHLGVRVIQADGRFELEGGTSRSDAGDPFPGLQSTDRFHAGAAPQSITHEGRAAGVTLTAIEEVGTDVRFRATTGFRDITVDVEGSDDPGLVLLDDQPLPPGGAAFTRAPFEAFILDAAAGQDLGPGVRRPFVEWSDDPSASRRRIYVTPLDGTTALTAVYGGEEVRLMPVLEGGILDVDPGALVTDPFAADLWVPLGEEVSVRAAPTPGYAFLDWTGDWSGRPNPFTVTPLQPLEVGARFGLTFASLATALAADRASLDAGLRAALDDFGNHDGRYDVGDLRAFLRRGETPLATSGAGGGP